MLLQFLHGHKWRALIIINQDSLVPRPLPLRKVLVLTVCMHLRKQFRHNFRKKLHALTLSYVEYYTKQEFFEIDSSGNSTCRILLEYYFSDMAVSFFQNLHSNRKIFHIGSLIATETLTSLCTRLVVAPP